MADASAVTRTLADKVRMSAVHVRPARPSDLPRLVEIASHSATAAQWKQAEYLKLFAIDEPEAQRQPIPRNRRPAQVPHCAGSGAGRAEWLVSSSANR